MAPSPPYDGNDFLLILLIIALLDGGDDPEIYDLLPFLERELERSSEQSSLWRRLPFSPHFLIRRIRRRSSLRQTDVDVRSASRALALVSDSVERIVKLERSYSSLDGKTDESLTGIKTSIAQINAGLSDLIWALSIGANLHEVKTNRNIPIRCYLSNADAKSAIGDRLIDLIFESLSELGIEKSIDLPPQSGSWWKQVWGRTKETLSQAEVAERLTKLEHAAEIRLIDKPQSDVTKTNADAASKMIKALDGVQSACVQIGNLLIVKFTPKRGDARLIIRTLTSSELIALEKNKSILKSPGKVIDMLDKECPVIDSSN